MKEFILNKLKENLLKENIDSKKLLVLAMKHSFENETLAKNYITKSIKELNNLPETITLYRVIFVKNENNINKNEIGSHYVINRKQLEQSHQLISHVGGGVPFILTVKSPKSLINLENTLENKIMYPHENEITLKNNGVGAKIIRIDRFEPKEDDFDSFNEFDY